MPTVWWPASVHIGQKSLVAPSWAFVDVRQQWTAENTFNTTILINAELDRFLNFCLLWQISTNEVFWLNLWNTKRHDDHSESRSLKVFVSKSNQLELVTNEGCRKCGDMKSNFQSDRKILCVVCNSGEFSVFELSFRTSPFECFCYSVTFSAEPAFSVDIN